MSLTLKSWATRPKDRVFSSLEDLYAFTKDRGDNSQEEICRVSDLNVDVEDSQLRIFTPSTSLRLNHWSIGQLSKQAQVPIRYLRKLDPSFAAKNLNYGLTNLLSKDHKINIYSTLGEARAFTSRYYGRIMDFEIVEMLEKTISKSVYPWTVPNPPTLYAGDRDMWMFLINENNPIRPFNPGKYAREELYRGIIVRNSEVGAATFSVMEFLYREICYNRMIYVFSGSEKKYSIRHNFRAPERLSKEGTEVLDKFLTTSPVEIEKKLERVMSLQIKGGEKEIIEWLQRRIRLGSANNRISKKLAKKVIERATQDEGSPNTVWNLVQGGTAVAKTIPYTDKRVALEQEFSKLLNLE